MKLSIVFLFVMLTFGVMAQSTETTEQLANTCSQSVSFVAKLDAKKATKEGFYVNGYVVHIAQSQADMYIGKKIKITGEVTIVAGIDNNVSSSSDPIQQGRSGDTKHIVHPTIELLN